MIKRAGQRPLSAGRRSTRDAISMHAPTIRTAAVSALLAIAAAAPLAAQEAAAPASDWRSGGVCYEVFVRSFYDSDGDGVGDLSGLTQKLDYINDGDPASRKDLGASCIWLMPVAQSPSYHGYDVTNYYQVNRDYGTNEDFKAMVAEAHRRGIRVLVDLVLNHSSSEHPRFRSALIDPASPYRDWYTFSPTVRPAPGWQAPVWHKVPDRDEHYYGLFWSGMPDLNLANPEVTAELKNVARFWLEEMGVDGFRLDAVAHFFEGEDGTPKHAPAVHPWLRDYAAYIRQVAPGSYTVGEVWDSTEAIAAYYPDQLDSYFIFEVADGMIDAARTGSKQRFLTAVERAERILPAGRWSPFLRNHDQNRTLTDLDGDVRRARVAATLLLTAPGTPFVYYGEELGMTASKPDPRLRTPMHWTRAPAAGFTRGAAWEPLQPDSLTANVEAQEADAGSLLNHYRELIHLRAANPALASGDFLPVETGSDAVVGYLRRTGGQTALVLVNLGDQRASGMRLSSADDALPGGRYRVRSLHGGGREGTLRVGSDGRLRGASPVPVLEPFGAAIVELSRRD